MSLDVEKTCLETSITVGLSSFLFKALSQEWVWQCAMFPSKVLLLRSGQNNPLYSRIPCSISVCPLLEHTYVYM